MNQQIEKTTIAMSSQPIPGAERAQGSVQRVDVIGREIIVLLPTGLAVFDVPCDCSILLRNEPVKLRVIQPGDQVQIAFCNRQGMLVAKILDVQPDSGFSCCRL
jgi:hypothetical protein